MYYRVRLDVDGVKQRRRTLRKKSPCSELFWFAFFPHFPVCGLNTERYSPYSVRMRENTGKMQTRITPNTDSFYALTISTISIRND